MKGCGPPVGTVDACLVGRFDGVEDGVVVGSLAQFQQP